ncbi:protein of hypothetical function/lipoprotein [Streptococcus sanguinis SK150]|uniref:Lipoprotein n=2 Tax=Streptococcus sanguinis TaxID=1305 RepID=A0AB74DSU0_STRSA|nr:hypothetical protein [Streptococcus sanguinis]EGD37443.1 protein of hypothetical function/lipoprotein [Streptococcus sanguinis SK150]KAF1306656.1 lipoprotein [Streptococcus sanguinis OH0843]MBZ2040795.1 hypothetical protein [Streptococcus sanguinis]MBZ2057684.1 hypothetical protein [Streptococcus sanguinis]RSI15167.1 hypothetical protein D8885_01635 [Streptococcus sanguinis]
MKKRTEIIIATVFSIVAIVMIGGCTLTQKESNKENQKVAYSKKAIKDDKEAIKQKQLAYLKNHEQEIIDLVKAQSPKIESVQIDWEETQWSDGGLTNPEYYINVFGRINNIEESGWGVDIPINDDKSIDMGGMYMIHEPTIGGRMID